MRIPVMASMLVALALLAACKKRFDGTCKVDADCLESQRCASQVCVRAKPIFAPYVPPPMAAVPPARKKPVRAAPVDDPAPAPSGDKPVPPPPRGPGLGPAVPKPPRDVKAARTFRLDA